MRNLYTDIYEMAQKGELLPPQIVTKTDLKTWIAIIGSTVTIVGSVVGSYFASANQMALTNQKLDILIATVHSDKIYQDNQIVGLEGRYGRLALAIQTINTILKIK
jgi:hypothetical protein